MPKRRTGPTTSPTARAHDCKAEKAIAKATADLERDNRKKDAALTKFMGHAEALGNKLLSTQSVGKRVVTDSLAVFGSVSSFELMNLGVRALAEWSKETEGQKGWLYKNVAYLQSLPGVVGAVAYLVDSLLQQNAVEKSEAAMQRGDANAMPYVVSDLRLGFNKWSAMLVNLGLGNLARAIRYSISEGVDEQKIKSEVIGQQDDRIKALQEEKAAAAAEANAELERLRTEIRQLRGGR